ncbi:hypothetical protein D3C76_1167370 [compost metagenome]
MLGELDPLRHPLEVDLGLFDACFEQILHRDHRIANAGANGGEAGAEISRKTIEVGLLQALVDKAEGLSQLFF